MKNFSIKASIGEWQSSVGEYLNLKLYTPYTKVFEGVAKGKFYQLVVIFIYHQEDGKTYADLDIDLVLLTEDNEKIYCKATGVFNYISRNF